jgi:hypothetical protein
VIEEVLKLTHNIYEVYCDAGFEAKRHYLAIFFKRFDIKNKKVAKVTHTPLFKKLLDSRKGRVSSKCPLVLYFIRSRIPVVSEVK